MEGGSSAGVLAIDGRRVIQHNWAIERGKRQGNGGKFDWESYCLNWLVQAAGEGKGDGGAQRKSRRRRAGQSRGEGEERKGEGRRLTSGTQSSARVKEKKTREAAWAGAGRGLVGRWAAGPERRGGFHLFFSFLFQTLFKSNFSFQIQTKILQTFSQNFINF
jgi:hypothetical protein